MSEFHKDLFPTCPSKFQCNHMIVELCVMLLLPGVHVVGGDKDMLSCVSCCCCQEYIWWVETKTC